MHLADEAGIVPFLKLAHAVAGCALVAHLGHHFVAFGGLGEGAGFVDIVGERLLHVDVLAQLHGGQGNHGVVVVGRGHRYGIEILALLIEQLPPVLIVPGLRKRLH